MYRPKKYVRLEPLARTPRLADIRNLLEAGKKSRSCTVEQPWHSENLKMPFSLTVRVELGNSGEPIWTLYEGEGSKSRVMWSTGFGDVELLYDVLTLSLPSDGPNIFDPSSHASSFTPTVKPSSTRSAFTQTASGMDAAPASEEERPASFYAESMNLPAHLAGDDFFKPESEKPAAEAPSKSNAKATFNRLPTSEFMVEPSNVSISAGSNHPLYQGTASGDQNQALQPAADMTASGSFSTQNLPGQNPGQNQGQMQGQNQGQMQTGQHSMQTGQHSMQTGSNEQQYPQGYPPGYPYPPISPNQGPYDPNLYPGQIPPGYSYPPLPPGYPVPPGYPQYPYPQNPQNPQNPNYPFNPNHQYPGYPVPPGYPPGNYPPGYNPNLYPPMPPQQVPQEGLTASTVPLSYPTGSAPAPYPTDPYGAPLVMPNSDLLKKRPTIMLGTFLVEAGLVPKTTIDAALQVQNLVSQGTLSAIKAAEAVRRAHQRGGYVEPENLQTVNPNESVVRVKPQLGQVLVMAGIITAPQLKVGLHLQDVMRSGALTMEEAVAALHKELGSTPQNANQSVKVDHEQIRKTLAVLMQADLLTEADLTAAAKVQKKHGGEVSSILVAAGKLDKHTIEAAKACQPFIEGGHLRVDQAIMALHYCQRTRMTFEEAVGELGFDTK